MMEDWEIRIPQLGERYLHYKGGVYTIICVGRLSEKRDEIMVVYRSEERGHIWIRPLGMWSDFVEWTAPPLAGCSATCRAQRFRLMLPDCEEVHDGPSR